MATLAEKLATSLEMLEKIQGRGGIAIQASELSRTHLERLVKNGFLQEVMKGWYVPSSQDQMPGESTAWYTSFWHFCSAYLNKRFGDNWCLSPEQSLSLHVGNWVVPKQLLVRSPKGSNKITLLPHKTSLFDVRYAMPSQKEVMVLEGLRVFSVASALVACSPRFFIQNSTDVRAALALIQDASEVLTLLLAKGHSVIAGRLAGAFRNIGRVRIADEIIKTISAVGYTIHEVDPFEEVPVIRLLRQDRSPGVNRLYLMWEAMRPVVLENFPKSSQKLINAKMYMKQVKAIYTTDAYHSLSIEGYRVSVELVERVRRGKWDPNNMKEDKKYIDVLVARGYWQAFNVVEKSIEKILKGANAGDVFNADHREWYREMFSPCVAAGILKPTDLAGYRRDQVYIRHSRHVPANRDAVRDLMSAFCDLLKDEKEPAVRVVLGHFFFVYIHPYMDGNGRIGRFLMNLMLAAGGYPWLVIPITKRKKYMAALEEASVRKNIMPFAKFLADLMKKDSI